MVWLIDSVTNWQTDHLTDWQTVCIWHDWSIDWLTTGTELESMVMSVDHPDLTFSLELINSEPSYEQPNQEWTFVSDFSVSTLVNCCCHHCHQCPVLSLKITLKHTWRGAELKISVGQKVYQLVLGFEHPINRIGSPQSSKFLYASLKHKSPNPKQNAGLQF